MEDRQINFIMYVIGVVGLVVLLGGAFGLYSIKYGVIGALIIWIIAGGYRKYFGIPKS